MRVDNYEGERIEVAEASTQELTRIRTEILIEIASQASLTPTRILLEEVDVIDEELKGRTSSRDV